jgi:hypothetical protein
MKYQDLNLWAKRSSDAPARSEAKKEKKLEALRTWGSFNGTLLDVVRTGGRDEAHDRQMLEYIRDVCREGEDEYIVLGGFCPNPSEIYRFRTNFEKPKKNSQNPYLAAQNSEKLLMSLRNAARQDDGSHFITHAIRFEEGKSRLDHEMFVCSEPLKAFTKIIGTDRGQGCLTVDANYKVAESGKPYIALGNRYDMSRIITCNEVLQRLNKKLQKSALTA